MAGSLSLDSEEERRGSEQVGGAVGISEWVFRPRFLFLVGTGGGGSRGECVEVEVEVVRLADGVWMFFLSHGG